MRQRTVAEATKESERPGQEPGTDRESSSKPALRDSVKREQAESAFRASEMGPKIVLGALMRPKRERGAPPPEAPRVFLGLHINP